MSFFMLSVVGVIDFCFMFDSSMSLLMIEVMCWQFWLMWCVSLMDFVVLLFFDLDRVVFSRLVLVSSLVSGFFRL